MTNSTNNTYCGCQTPQSVHFPALKAAHISTPKIPFNQVNLLWIVNMWVIQNLLNKNTLYTCFLPVLGHFPVSRCKHITQIFYVLRKRTFKKYMEKHITNSFKTCQLSYPPTYSLQAHTPTTGNNRKSEYTEKIHSTRSLKAHWEIYIFRLSSSVSTAHKEPLREWRPLARLLSAKTNPAHFL